MDYTEKMAQGEEQGIAYIVDLALPVENGWLPVSFGDRPGPAGACTSRQRMSRMLACGRSRPGCVP